MFAICTAPFSETTRERGLLNWDWSCLCSVQCRPANTALQEKHLHPYVFPLPLLKYKQVLILLLAFLSSLCQGYSWPSKAVIYGQIQPLAFKHPYKALPLFLLLCPGELRRLLCTEVAAVHCSSIQGWGSHRNLWTAAGKCDSIIYP